MAHRLATNLAQKPLYVRHRMYHVDRISTVHENNIYEITFLFKRD